MNVLSILIIAMGLGMDAFSVAISAGAFPRTDSLRAALRLSFAFGIFQTIMPIAGWVAGTTVADMIASYDHWVAFAILSGVGGKMIMESVSRSEKNFRTDPTRGWTLLMLSVATSIDALAVGLGFAFLKIPILCPSLIIGIVTFIMSMIGMFFGKALGKILGTKVEMIGGIILVGIGVKILMEHLK
jgi:manganese efflux pump family protein